MVTSVSLCVHVYRYQQIGEPTPVMSEGSDYESKTDSKRPKSTVMLDYQGKD